MSRDGTLMRVTMIGAVVIATEWEQFRALDLERLRCIMARPVIVDLRNVYRAEEMKRAKLPLSHRRPSRCRTPPGGRRAAPAQSARRAIRHQGPC
jgi:UDP-glucose/GDP-mannose dehydrogenase family, UDP binding domain